MYLIGRASDSPELDWAVFCVFGQLRRLLFNTPLQRLALQIQKHEGNELTFEERLKAHLMLEQIGCKQPVRFRWWIWVNRKIKDIPAAK